jgi:hypothetical protein
MQALIKNLAKEHRSLHYIQTLTKICVKEHWSFDQKEALTEGFTNEYRNFDNVEGIIKGYGELYNRVYQDADNKEVQLKANLMFRGINEEMTQGHGKGLCQGAWGLQPHERAFGEQEL